MRREVTPQKVLRALDGTLPSRYLLLVFFIFIYLFPWNPCGRISLFKLDCCRRRRKVIFQDDRRGIRNTENGFKWTARVTRYTRYTYWKGVPSGGLASRQSFILIHSVDAAGRGWVTATVKHYSRTISVHSQSGVKPRGWAPYVRGASARLGGARGLCMMS